jgi:uncharacterized membrane protein
MQQRPEISPPSKTRDRGRIVSIDILRGLVIALMALDHTRDFFSNDDFNPRNVAEPALFLTRWATHFCAPTFVFLAGLSAYLYGRGRTPAELRHFLLTRGAWLILIEFTVVSFAWTFEFRYPLDLFAGVIWVIGASMICLAALTFLPRATIAIVAIALIAGHNLLDGIQAEHFGAASALWRILHDPSSIALGGGNRVYALYALMPWAGVMAAGYAAGPIMTLEPDSRRRLLFRLGAAATLGFVLLRATNVYGDAAPWRIEATPLQTALSFINCEKYPPSLLFLMMTLGPALMLLAGLETARGRIAHWLSTYGEVPFFFYVVHLYVIHGLAVAAGLMIAGVLVLRPELSLGLPVVYAIWLGVLLLLYPLCLWFAKVKARQGEWWWRYL